MSIARRFVLPAALSLVIGTLLGSAGPALAAAPQGWTQFMYSAAHTGLNSRETTLTAANAPTLAVRWSRSVGDSVEGSPVVAGGRVFVETVSGSVFALHASTGRPMWSATVGAYASASSPAIWSNLVIASARNASETVVAAFDRTTGKRAWRTVLSGEGGFGGLTVSGSSVFLATGQQVARLSARTGAVVWQTTVTTAPYDSGIWGPIAVSSDGAHVVAASIDGVVFDFDAGTGAIRWQTTAGGGVYRGGPAISGDRIFVPEGATAAEGGGFDVVALRLSNGSQVWRGYAGDDVHLTPGVANGLVYVGAIDTGVRALDAATGVERWVIESLPEVWSAPSIANGVVYQATESSLLAINAVTGAQLFVADTSNGYANMSSPAIWGGRLYVGSGDGTVRVFAPA